MYHSISDSEWFYALSPYQFERQVRYLSESYKPVALSEIYEFVEGKRQLSDHSVALTFDDGYRDFLTEALPILERYKVPATVFLSVGPAGERKSGEGGELLTSEEIKLLASHPLVEIASHGLTHRKLTQLRPEEAENEIKSSKVILEEQTSRPVLFFAYPYGSFNAQIIESVARAGYRGAVAALPFPIRRACSETRFRSEIAEFRASRPGGKRDVSCDISSLSRWVSQPKLCDCSRIWGFRTRSRGSDPFALGRMDVNKSLSFFEFKLRLTRVGDWYFKLWKILRKKPLW